MRKHLHAEWANLIKQLNVKKLVDQPFCNSKEWNGARFVERTVINTPLFFCLTNYNSYRKFFLLQTNFGHKLARGNLQVSFSNVWIFPWATNDMSLYMWNDQNSSHTTNHCYAINCTRSCRCKKMLLVL